MKLSASNADVAHLVERNLAKVEVASSSLVIRSIIAPTHCVGVYFFAIADMPYVPVPLTSIQNPL